MSFIGKIKSHLPGFIGGTSGKSNAPKVPLDTVDLAKSGISAMSSELRNDKKVDAGRIYLKKIKSQSQDQKEVILAKTALKLHGPPNRTSPPLESTLRILASGVSSPIGTMLSLVAKSCGSPSSLLESVTLKPYIEAIRDNSKEPDEVILAQTALKVKRGSSQDPRAKAYKAVLKTIQSGVSGINTSLILAETGLDATRSSYIPQDKAKSGKPFVEAIVKHSPANSKEAKIAQKALAMPATDGSYKIYEKALKEVYDLLKPPSAWRQKNIGQLDGVEKMINQYKEKQEGKSGENSETDMKIVVEEKKVNIGGVELPRRIHRLINRLIK